MAIVLQGGNNVIGACETPAEDDTALIGMGGKFQKPSKHLS
jgi:hypothetical protein